jgi:iron complex transport system ATP-binding protein
MNSIEIDNITFSYPEGIKPVFSDLSINLEPGCYSLTGPNGAGKTTFLLLAGGRMLPEQGSIQLLGRDVTDYADEEERNLAASFLYQNMEFESEQNLGELLQIVAENGNLASAAQDIYTNSIEVLELKPVLNRKTQEMSKGELQRGIIAFALLYGSPVLLMDEPVFAMEQRQKEASLELIYEYQKSRDLTVLFSVHELELSRKYSNQVLLFYKNGEIQGGEPNSLLTAKPLEEAYGVPYAMLHEKEALFRSNLQELSELTRKQNQD